MSVTKTDKDLSQISGEHPTASEKGLAKKNPIGDPCEFILPPNQLLAKVTHDPKMAEVFSVKKGQFTFDKSRLKKMTSIIKKNEAVCVDTLNQKIKKLEPLYKNIRNGNNPSREEFIERCQYIHSVSKALDHIPISRITASLLKYLNNLPENKGIASSIIITHFDALFNRKTLNIALDPSTNIVLTALEALTEHALTTSS